MDTSDPTLEAIKIVQAERSLHEFVRQAWPQIEARPFIDGYHVGAICEHLTAVIRGQLRRLIITVPPRMSKSTVVSCLWPVWAWIERPSIRWLFASYALSLAMRDSVKSRRVIMSSWFQERWRDRFQLTSDQNVKSRYENDRTGYRLTTSVDSGVTGEGGDINVIDDALNVNDATPTVLANTNDWWDGAFSNRVNDAKTSSFVIIGQRVAVNDLIGHVLGQGGGFEELRLPMEFEPQRRTTTSIGFTDWRKEEGELLCPERFGADEVAFQKLKGPHHWASQFQQRPTIEGGSIIQRPFRYFTTEHVTWRNPRDSRALPMPTQVFHLEDADGSLRTYYAHQCSIFQTVDTAMTVKTTSDYTVIGTFALTPDYDLLILDIFRKRLLVPEQYETIMLERKRWPRLIGTWVEKAASGFGIIQQSHAEGTPLLELPATQARDTVRESAPLATLYRAGKVWHLHPSLASWVAVYEDEATTFPHNDHDDQVIVAAWAAKLAIEERMVRQGVNRDLFLYPSPADSLDPPHITIGGVKIAVEDDDAPAGWWTR